MREHLYFFCKYCGDQFLNKHSSPIETFLFLFFCIFLSFPAHIWALFYLSLFWFYSAHLWAANVWKSHIFTQNWNFDFLWILYRNNCWGCGNQTFFGKRHTLTLLPRKFSWKTDKLILPPHLFEIDPYFVPVRNFCHFYNSHTAV